MKELERGKVANFRGRRAEVRAFLRGQSSRPVLPPASVVRRANHAGSNQPPRNEVSRLLTIRDLSDLLRVSVRELWRMRDNGRLPNPIEFGPKNIRWPRDEILAWVEAGCPRRSLWEAIRGRRDRGK